MYSPSLMMDNCHQRRTWALLKTKPFICSRHFWTRRLIDWDKPRGWWIFVRFIWVSMTQTKGCSGEWLITAYGRLHPCFCCLNATGVDWWLWSGFRCCFQWLSDLFSLIASPRILYSGWPAPCEKHINREYLIFAVFLRLNDPESKQNENCPSAGPCIAEQPWTGK